MGWVNSVALLQHLHRRLGLQPEPLGGGLKGEDEMRRDRPTPLSATQLHGGWIQYYLDDFDCPEIVPSSMWKTLKGTMSETHQRQRDAYSQVGVKIAANKAHVREPKVERMGAMIDGVEGWLSVSNQKKLECGYFVFWAMRRKLVTQKVVMMILGRLARCFEFRRPLMSLLNHSWPRLPRRVARPLGLKCWLELIHSICILPMAATNLFTPVSGLVTCSDASEYGGGLCATAGLSDFGESTLLKMDRQGHDRETVQFQPSGSCQISSKARGPRILVVSLFDGVGAVMAALVRLPCQVVAYAACEIDRACKRLVRTRWPGVIELGDICKVTELTILHLKEAVGYKIDLVLVSAGSPCQDLSQLNAGRKGLAGMKARLFFEVPRVIKMLKDTFDVPVESFVENVYSISSDSRTSFSDVLETEPVMVDAKYFTACRRPRDSGARGNYSRRTMKLFCNMKGAKNGSSWTAGSLRSPGWSQVLVGDKAMTRHVAPNVR